MRKYNSSKVVVIIPSYEPDERLLFFLSQLEQALPPNYTALIVDDGSGPRYEGIFNAVKNQFGITVLHHSSNLGKGRALKTGFLFCKKNCPGAIGCITADCDGQHTSSQIMRMADALEKNQHALILGERCFDSNEIPFKSKFGNIITRKVFNALYHKDIPDTQTGLRAIPMEWLDAFIGISGDRFEYEIRQLIYAVENEIEIIEVPIETIYDSKEHHSTHFKPVKDSIRIYHAFGSAFGRFFVSSISSSVVDLLLFQLLCIVLKNNTMQVSYIVVSTIVARCLSATYNYLLNYYYVFRSSRNHFSSAPKYFMLAIAQMICSALLTTVLVNLFSTQIEVVVKIPVDTLLFFISYKIQRWLVY